MGFAGPQPPIRPQWDFSSKAAAAIPAKLSGAKDARPPKRRRHLFLIVIQGVSRFHGAAVQQTNRLGVIGPKSIREPSADFSSTSWAWAAEAVLPVPMAHTGS